MKSQLNTVYIYYLFLLQWHAGGLELSIQNDCDHMDYDENVSFNSKINTMKMLSPCN